MSNFGPPLHIIQKPYIVNILNKPKLNKPKVKPLSTKQKIPKVKPLSTKQKIPKVVEKNPIIRLPSFDFVNIDQMKQEYTQEINDSEFISQVELDESDIQRLDFLIIDEYEKIICELDKITYIYNNIDSTHIHPGTTLYDTKMDIYYKQIAPLRESYMKNLDEILNIYGTSY
tara:strand:- start:2765 stop:3280 length:516 start_codon:yes stop_codon:yes gene_type:complete